MDRRQKGVAVYASQLEIPENELVRVFSDRFGPRFTEEALYASGGTAWEDEPLSLRDRSLIVIAALVALGGVEARLRPHVRWAVDHGLTADELDAAVCLLANYVGFARASVALEVARDELAILEGGKP